MLILFEVQQPTFGFPKRHILAVKAPTINSWEPGAAATWQQGAVNSTRLWDGIQWCYPNEWISWSFGHSHKKPIKTSFTKHQGFISPQINTSEYTLIFLPVGMWVWSFALLSCCQKTIPNNSTPKEKLKGYTLQGINISHLGKRKIIFKMPFLGDMLIPWRVFRITRKSMARLGRGFGIFSFFLGGVGEERHLSRCFDVCVCVCDWFSENLLHLEQIYRNQKDPTFVISKKFLKVDYQRLGR